MNALIRHIEYLISRKDCVIIPNVGAILASTIPASYDAAHHTITPPRRLLTFNSELAYNDGILAASIQRADEISYEAASRKVKGGVDALLALISTQGYARIGQLGIIQRDVESLALTFTATPEYESNADALWLKPVQLKPLIADNVIEAPITKHMSRSSRIARIAASIAVLIGLGFVLSTPIQVDDAMLASLAPELTQATAAELVPEREISVAENVYQGEAITLDEPEVSAPVLTVTLPVPTPDSTVDVASRQDMIVEPDGRYFVVVASLATRAEGLEYISQRPDSGLKLYASGHYYRVYTSAHATLADAFAASAAASMKYPDAWVCKK